MVDFICEKGDCDASGAEIKTLSSSHQSFGGQSHAGHVLVNNFVFFRRCGKELLQNFKLFLSFVWEHSVFTTQIA